MLLRARNTQPVPLRPRLQGRARGLRPPVPRRRHAPRAQARRGREGRRERALGRRGPRPGGFGGRVRARRHQGDDQGGRPRHAQGRVEKAFEIAKQGGRVLPARVLFWRGDFLQAPPDVPRGHRGDQDDADVLASRRTSPAVESMPKTPRERHAIEYDGRLITTEPVRKMNEAHGAFGIRCPDTIGLPVVG